MTRPRAVILLRPDLDPDRQFAVCNERMQQRRYELVSLLHVNGDWSSAEALVRDGLVDVVIIASLDRATEGLEERIEEAGGQVEAVHRAQRRATVRSMVAVLHEEEGWPVQRIAATFGMSTRDVLDHIRRSANGKCRDQRESTSDVNVNRPAHRGRYAS